MYIRWSGDYDFENSKEVLDYRYVFSLDNIFFRNIGALNEDTKFVLKNLSNGVPDFNDSRIFCKNIKKEECELIAKNDPRDTLDSIAFGLSVNTNDFIVI